MLNDNLWSLLDSGMFDTEGPVNNALIGSIASVLENQFENGEELLNNLSPKTADINGIAVWEQILGIPINSSYSLAQRQSIASAKAYRLIGSLTKQQLVDILNLFSPSKSAEVIESPSTYQVYGQMLASEVANLHSLLMMVKNVLPAHLQFIPAFIAVVIEEFQVQRTMKISFTRNTWANNGGIKSTGKIMDETAKKLDGTWNLDDAAHPDFDVFHSIQMVISRVISLAPIPIKATSIVVTRPAIAEQFSTGQQKGITVNRVATALSQQTLLTGSWVLDGSVNLNRSAYPMTIKINGTAV